MTKIHVNLDGRTVLVAGSPGFIGAGLVLRLLKTMKAGTVVSLDDMPDDCDSEMKRYRLDQIGEAAAASPVKHILVQGSIADRALVDEVFERYCPGVVVNLAARCLAGAPHACVESELVGFFNLLDACRRHPVAHLVYGSSASVYGDSGKLPFRAGDRVGQPLSLDAAARQSGELLAQSYARMYGLPCTGLRLFTAYGPSDRPDSLCHSAAEGLLRGERVPVLNHGNCLRDFTYIDDIVEAILRVMQGAPERRFREDGSPLPPWAVYNIGSGRPENLLDFLRTLHGEMVRAGLLAGDFDLNAHLEPTPLSPADMPVAFADIATLEADYCFRPVIGIREGLRRFVAWYGVQEAQRGIASRP